MWNFKYISDGCRLPNRIKVSDFVSLYLNLRNTKGSLHKKNGKNFAFCQTGEGVNPDQTAYKKNGNPWGSAQFNVLNHENVEPSSIKRLYYYAENARKW